MKKYHKALTIAGSDSGGGAGIQADLKTFAAFGCYGMSVITALTAQNTVTVKSIFPVSTQFISDQLDAIFEDMGADAVKIGMLFSAEIIEVVASKLKQYDVSQIVLDPVMIAKSGDHLLQESAIDSLISLLIPMATVITPNIPEAEILTGIKIDSLGKMLEAAQRISDLGAQSVLIKGGHWPQTQSQNLFYIGYNKDTVVLPFTKIASKNTHGTGCTLSSAITACLAKGYPIKMSIKESESYLQKAIKEGAKYTFGKGNGPVQHFHEFWEDTDFEL